MACSAAKRLGIYECFERNHVRTQTVGSMLEAWAEWPKCAAGLRVTVGEEGWISSREVWASDRTRTCLAGRHALPFDWD